MQQNLLLYSVIVATLFFVLMIVMNVLANTLPLGGVSTGEVSFKYPNLFQPSGMTFSIWGIIYLLLGAYVVFQLSYVGRMDSDMVNTYTILNLLFALTSIANILWLISWHYDKIGLSLVMMILLFILLVFISLKLDHTSGLTHAAFGVYFGWITVALIANVTIWLVKLGIPHDALWSVLVTAMILVIGLVVACYVLYVQKNIFYGAVFIWAYLGIFMRHMSVNELNKAYPILYGTAAGALVMLMIWGFYLFFLPHK